MRPGVPEDPPTAVHVDDDGQHRPGVAGPDEPHAHVADRGGHGDPLLVDGQLVHRLGLQVVEDLARPLRTEVGEERGLGGGLDEILRGGFEDDLRGAGHRAAEGSARKARSSWLISLAWVTHMTWGPPSIST